MYTYIILILKDKPEHTQVLYVLNTCISSIHQNFILTNKRDVYDLETREAIWIRQDRRFTSLIAIHQSQLKFPQCIYCYSSVCPTCISKASDQQV